MTPLDLPAREAAEQFQAANCHSPEWLSAWEVACELYDRFTRERDKARTQGHLIVAAGEHTRDLTIALLMARKTFAADNLDLVAEVTRLRAENAKLRQLATEPQP